jgi:hypothetical protein
VTEPAAQDALVVQAYGGERHRQRARFTVLTFQHYALRAAAPP